MATQTPAVSCIFCLGDMTDVDMPEVTHFRAPGDVCDRTTDLKIADRLPHKIHQACLARVTAERGDMCIQCSGLMISSVNGHPIEVFKKAYQSAKAKDMLTNAIKRLGAAFTFGGEPRLRIEMKKIIKEFLGEAKLGVKLILTFPKMWHSLCPQVRPDMLRYSSGALDSHPLLNPTTMTRILVETLTEITMSGTPEISLENRVIILMETAGCPKIREALGHAVVRAAATGNRPMARALLNMDDSPQSMFATRISSQDRRRAIVAANRHSHAEIFSDLGGWTSYHCHSRAVKAAKTTASICLPIMAVIGLFYLVLLAEFSRAERHPDY